ncbi:uncharacterized protein PODANS_5_1825 [Podospora anserina S mat+]|uniref:Podospora anserina S mat+ genomic DNA chromosome 5, supercontig 1 n=1 Tax=Podospora anserina (strain S / ATCC MYA-4624 / DSM 980 / FGSC 10383) TaxID=515849 RepID=B2AEQ6_PODAN|nr:uncharacterized protein PODANS_5_1825 [Podospora anserina S mat+]CAP61922.1 unnamed protein product [Podospora anserina S mat+]CDP28997.1 Putative protein of unknown function [Podospora anserina S mat+]
MPHSCAGNDATYCNREAQAGKRYCTRHGCKSLGCANPKATSYHYGTGTKTASDYCSQHACAESGCFRKRSPSQGATYCSQHACQFAGCLKGIYQRSDRYCAAHYAIFY